MSHLPGARLADAKAPAAQLLSGLCTNQAIVVYCSVGYRSSRLVERLQQAGYTNAFNLDGSIFQWATKTGRWSAMGSRSRKCIPTAAVLASSCPRTPHDAKPGKE